MGEETDFTRAFLMFICIYLEHHLIGAVSFNYISAGRVEKELIYRKQDQTTPQNLPIDFLQSQCSFGPSLHLHKRTRDSVGNIPFLSEDELSSYALTYEKAEKYA